MDLLKLTMDCPSESKNYEVGQKLEVRSVNRQTGEITVETDWDKFIIKVECVNGPTKS